MAFIEVFPLCRACDYAECGRGSPSWWACGRGVFSVITVLPGRRGDHRAGGSARAGCVAEQTHRQRAIIEQVDADLKNSALAHMPSAVFPRELGLAGCRGHGLQPHPRRRPPCRRALRQRIRLHLPEAWPWQNGLGRALHQRPRPTASRIEPRPPAGQRPDL